MLNKYALAQAFVFKWEGGYCDIAGDSGGATNMGISLRFLRGISKEYGDIDGDGDIDKDDIKHLSKEDALHIYKKFFWEANKVEQLPLYTAIVFYDLAVNAGGGRAGKILQNACNFYPNCTLKVDGQVGPKTLACVKNICTTSKEDKLLALRIIDQRKRFYEQIIRANPVLAKFRKGWFARCADLEAYINSL